MKAWSPTCLAYTACLQQHTKDCGKGTYLNCGDCMAIENICKGSGKTGRSLQRLWRQTVLHTPVMTTKLGYTERPHRRTDWIPNLNAVHRIWRWIIESLWISVCLNAFIHCLYWYSLTSFYTLWISLTFLRSLFILSKSYRCLSMPILFPMLVRSSSANRFRVAALAASGLRDVPWKWLSVDSVDSVNVMKYNLLWNTVKYCEILWNTVNYCECWLSSFVVLWSSFAVRFRFLIPCDAMPF